MLFFKHFWKEMKADLIKVMVGLWEGKARLDRINYAFIALILKKDAQRGGRKTDQLPSSTVC